jgi:formylglycine-generating enzyme required for sulfatase activity
LRGGGFTDTAFAMRSSIRHDETPSSRRANNGGRCVRPLP